MLQKGNTRNNTDLEILSKDEVSRPKFIWNIMKKATCKKNEAEKKIDRQLKTNSLQYNIKKIY